MLPPQLILEHLIALAAVWGCALIAGLPLVALLRTPLGLGGAALLGLAYWAASLYLLPFHHGLDVAIAVASCGFIVTLFMRPAALKRLPTRLRCLAAGVLFVGCAGFASLLFTQLVPPGMDASMHTTGARLIAELRGLPQTYAPFAPELHLPAVNLGLPALVAVPIRLGCSPAAAMLAGEQFAYSLFVLSIYLLLRLWAARTAAAVLAVFAVWTTRGAQETVGWGGFPTIAALALGLLAARLLIDLARHPNYRLAGVLGLTIGALPLTHGVSAATWFYAVAPVPLLVGLATARRRQRAVGSLAVAAAVASFVLLAYRAFGRAQVGQEEIDWVRASYANFFPTEDGWQLLRVVPAYIKTNAGSVGVWPGVVAVVVLLIRGWFRAAAALAGAFVLLCCVVADARFWVLPMSILLYPERAVYWATPLAAVAMTLAWRSLGSGVRGLVSLRVALLGILIPAAGLKHVQGFQRDAIAATVSRAEWSALLWSAANLNAKSDLVESSYKTAGSYLPAVAGIATTGWHMHFFALQEIPVVMRNRPVTHVFVRQKDGTRADLSAGQVVFQNSEVAIVRLTK
jgi:hypothetical protein